MDFRRARALANRVGDLFDRLPEEVSGTGACGAYQTAILEIEEKSELFEATLDVRERAALDKDMRKAVQRANRQQPRCARQLERFGSRVRALASTLPKVRD